MEESDLDRDDRDPELDADTEVRIFHDFMRLKGACFYGVAVKPPKGMESEVQNKLEEILRKHGYGLKFRTIEGYIAFQGEYSDDSMEEVRTYLESIEDRTPAPPVMKKGDYFQMLGYDWLDGTVNINKYFRNLKK